MFIVKNLSKSFGSKSLFENISFTLVAGEKVALVGKNGSGKSTFLKILAGLDDSDSGSFTIRNECISYVPQELSFLEGDTIGTFCCSDEHKVISVLTKVGMESFPITSLLCKLSGGQKTRVMIARALLSSPTVLLLDEPTNHLDNDGSLWFQNFLGSFSGSVFMVSHDRELLERMDRIFEINHQNKTFDLYHGGWSSYIKLKDRKILERQGAYDDQQKERKRLEEYLKWRQVQARAHSNPNLGAQIRMMKRRIEREITDQEIFRPQNSKTISKISLSGSTNNSKLLVKIKDVSLTLGVKRLLHKISFEIRGKERVFISGKNGTGKSTLLKIILGMIPIVSGSIKNGTNINIGYFAQEHEILNFNETVLESYENTERTQIEKCDSRRILASFLFFNNDLQKKISELSPGERVRLIFAKLISQKNELLLLDEPTNHLDIESRQAIENALQNYEGGIVFVSHDAHFNKSLNVNRELRIENGELKEYLLS